MSSRNGHRRVTMADVGRHAGVSTGAVSKVLRKAYGVSPEMETRVRTAIEELGYRPHAAARGLRGRTYTLGLLLPDLRNAFFADILEGVTEQAVAAGCQVLIGAAGPASVDQSKLADAMVDRQMDGLILVGPSIPLTTVELIASEVPAVVLGYHERGYNFDTVVDDDRSGAAQVVDHLAGLGHRHIDHTAAGGLSHLGWHADDERSKGYADAMRRHGLEPRVRVSTYTEKGGYQGAMDLLRAPVRPTAIFAGADMAALGVMRAAAELGLRIPRDLSLVGYDNSYLADLAPIQLTSVEQQGRELGAAAATLLAERIDGRTEPRFITQTPRLVVRSSTAAPSDQ